VNEIQGYYETYWSEKGFYPHGNLWPGLARLYATHIMKGQRVLDVGCGDGLTSGIWLRDRGCDYIGVDVSENAVRDSSNAGFHAQKIEDAAKLPFPDDSFDVVVCIEVLEHLFSPHKAVEEIVRVLRPGGVLMLTVPNVAAWRWRLDMFALGRWNPIGDELSGVEPWRDPHIRFFTTRILKAMLLQRGLSVDEVSGHAGGFLMYLPYLRRFAKAESSWLYRLLEKACPSLLAHRLHAVAHKQTTGI
jgi:methionine biosynthesis protein MetW